MRLILFSRMMNNETLLLLKKQSEHRKRKNHPKKRWRIKQSTKAYHQVDGRPEGSAHLIFG